VPGVICKACRGRVLAGRWLFFVVPRAHSASARVRQTTWFVLHLFTGALVSLASVVLVPTSLRLLASPWVGVPELWPVLPEDGIEPAAAVALGVLLPVGVLAVGAGLGWCAARVAPLLLGPDPAERLAQLERRTAELTERTRLARELHDSIGHALSVTTLQATAARKVLADDPEFAAEAPRPSSRPDGPRSPTSTTSSGCCGMSARRGDRSRPLPTWRRWWRRIAGPDCRSTSTWVRTCGRCRVWSRARPTGSCRRD
jgi:hypothetical protein